MILLSSLHLSGLEIAVHMALIREAAVSQIRNRCHIVVLMVLFLFRLVTAKLRQLASQCEAARWAEARKYDLFDLVRVCSASGDKLNIYLA